MRAIIFKISHVVLCLCVCINAYCYANFADDFQQKVYSAVVNITYKFIEKGDIDIVESGEIGRFGLSSRLDGEYGWLVHVRTADNESHGCSPPVNMPLDGRRWIALVERGSCKFHTKISNAAISRNATAVVVYNNVDTDLLTMEHNVEDVVAVFVSRRDGLHYARLVDSGVSVWMSISVGRQLSVHSQPMNRTSVLFVFVSFIILMVVTLVWLVFYYIQRFRYAHNRERFVRHLVGAAKKAINKMPTRRICASDDQLMAELDQCAICIEVYKPNDVIRELPCRHVFHMACVDPWLMGRHCCPMCKLDIVANQVATPVIEPSPLASRTGSVSVPVNSIELGQVQLHPTHAMYVVREQCGMVDTVDNTCTLPDCCVSSVSDTWVRCRETEAQPLIGTNVCREV